MQSVEGHTFIALALETDPSIRLLTYMMCTIFVPGRQHHKEAGHLCDVVEVTGMILPEEYLSPPSYLST